MRQLGEGCWIPVQQLAAEGFLLTWTVEVNIIDSISIFSTKFCWNFIDPGPSVDTSLHRLSTSTVLQSDHGAAAVNFRFI